jgi:RIO kinase 1
MMHGGVPYLIDVGQGVLLDHPKAEEFLRRDVENILRYFRKYEVEKDLEDVLKWVRGSV